MNIDLLLSKLKLNNEQQKIIHYFCKGGKETSIPQDQCLSSPGKPRHANDHQESFFYPPLKLMIDSYYLTLDCLQ